jgi:hypothetical protein
VNQHTKRGAPGATIVPDAPLTPEVYGLRGLDERWVDVPSRADANANFVCEAPRDGGMYARRDGRWLPVESGAVWIGPAPPAAPVQGTLWWRDDPDGVLYIFFDGAWVPASPSGGGGVDPALFLRKAGDTMTGDLVVTNPADSGTASVALRNQFGNPTIALAIVPGSGSASNIIFNFGGGVGWGVSVEEGVFHVYHIDPIAGQAIPFSIERDNHIEMVQPRTVSGDPVDPNDLARKAYVDQIVTAAPAIIGAIDASTGVCRFTDSTGPVPPASSVNPGAYLICDVAGTIPSGPAAGTAMVRGDWLFSDGVSVWHELNVGSEGAATMAGQVAVIPPLFGQPNVQAALGIAEARIAALEPLGWNVPNVAAGVAVRNARWRAQPGGVVRWDGCFQLTNFTVSTNYQTVFASGAPAVPGADGRAFIVPATQGAEAYSFLLRFMGTVAQLRILNGHDYPFVSGTNVLVYLDGVTYLSTSTQETRR